MDYLFVKLIWYVVAALALGFAFGWYTCGRSDAGDAQRLVQITNPYFEFVYRNSGSAGQVTGCFGNSSTRKRSPIDP